MVDNIIPLYYALSTESKHVELILADFLYGWSIMRLSGISPNNKGLGWLLSHLATKSINGTAVENSVKLYHRAATATTTEHTSIQCLRMEYRLPFSSSPREKPAWQRPSSILTSRQPFTNRRLPRVEPTSSTRYIRHINHTSRVSFSESFVCGPVQTGTKSTKKKKPASTYKPR